MRVDACTILDVGRRDYQEDAILCAQPLGAGIGFNLLADGMGGHVGGDLASRIAITETLRVILEATSETADLDRRVPGILSRAAQLANARIRHHVEKMPEFAGMGSTLVATVQVGDRLYWVSVGDSLLYLWRDGRLARLNAEHSMAASIDRMAVAGQISARTAAAHPDRSMLTSALTGGKISAIDCPAQPQRLRDGDIVIVASDGICTLPPAELARVVGRHARAGSFELGAALLEAIKAAADPAQDNISISINRMRT